MFTSEQCTEECIITIHRARMDGKVQIRKVATRWVLKQNQRGEISLNVLKQAQEGDCSQQ